MKILMLHDQLDVFPAVLGLDLLEQHHVSLRELHRCTPFFGNPFKGSFTPKTYVCRVLDIMPFSNRFLI